MTIPSNLANPIAIVLAGALVAAALYFGGGSSTATPPTQPTGGDPIELVAVSPDEHILGNPNAPIKVVEYTDLECPFCKQFHGTMHQIIDKYGPSGQVAWVLRNFPLEQLHPNAPELAEAAECVAKVGGNDAYWAFIDEVFRIAPINTFFDFTKLDATVAKVGVNVASFKSCYDQGTFRAKIAKELQDAITSGGNGTPHNLLVEADGTITPIPGAQPFATVDQMIQAALAK